MAGVLGFEPRKCQIQSLMPYRLAIPQCAYLLYTICVFLTSVFYVKRLFFCVLDKIGSIVRKCLELMSFSHWVVKIIGEKKRIYKWEVKE